MTRRLIKEVHDRLRRAEATDGRERIKTPDASRITGICERTLQNLAAKGDVWGAAKLGRRWTFDERKLRAWIAANENEPISRKISMSGRASGTPALRSTDENVASRFKRALEEKLNGASRHG